MHLWNDFVHGSLPYQHLWLPLAIGVAAGAMCILAGNLVWRGGKRPITPPSKAEPPAGFDPFVQGSPSEQRRSYRRGGNLVRVFYARLGNREKPQQALVLDRSLGGLRLAADEDIEAGTKLLVLPANAPETTPWVEIEVRTTQMVDDSWELRCQFLKTPQWSVLLLFG